MKLKLYLLIFSISFLFLSAQGQTSNKRSPFKIIAYYPLQAAITADLTSVPFTKVTHINLWFVNPDSLGVFTQDFPALTPFIQVAHRNHVKVLISIGGGSKQTQYRTLLKDDKRSLLINNLVAVVRNYNIDGIDVDLEGSDIDENYEKFIVELAASLKRHKKLLTAAIAIYYKDQFTDKALAQYDFVNIMSYDRTGPWRPDKPGPHATYEHAVEDLEYFGTVRAIPKDKMTLGVPFYGYGYGPTLTSKAISMNYAEILSAFPGSHSADTWEMPGGMMLYYNGINTIKQKTALAKEKASGIMIWQLMGDAAAPNSLLDAIYEAAYGKK